MIGFDEAVRLARLQERVRASTYHMMRQDGHHKSSEGHVSLAFNLPPVVGDERDPYWTLEVYSYLLCPEGRHQSWQGRSAAEVISKGEDAIGEWCLMPEMEMFEQAMGITHDDPDDDDPGSSEEDIPI